MHLRSYLAEFIGTFFLVFSGTSAILGSVLAGYDGTVAVPFAFGLALVVGIFAVGHISGAHFNPAVTIAFAVGRHFPWGQVGPYIAAQLLGGLAASGVLALAFGAADGFTAGPTVPGDAAAALGSVLPVLLAEFFATFLLMFVITAVATDTRIEGIPAGLAIGFTVAAMAFATGWIGGGSFNPARSFGPALVDGTWTLHWLYWAGPVLGAVAAVTTYNVVRGPEPEGPPPAMTDPTLD
ncbi:MAG: aquaporin [Bacteroidota bacterium]